MQLINKPVRLALVTVASLIGVVAIGWSMFTAPNYAQLVAEEGLGEDKCYAFILGDSQDAAGEKIPFSRCLDWVKFQYGFGNARHSSPAYDVYTYFK